MKIVVPIVVILMLSEQGDSALYKWSGHVGDLVNRARIQRQDVFDITRRIFGTLNRNCRGKVGMPKLDQFPSPTQGCDLEMMDELSYGLRNPKLFEADKFLESFWFSTPGEGLMKEMNQRGVSDIVLKDAMKELWFSQSRRGDCAFNRLFLGVDTFGQLNLVGFNSWYTFDMAKKARDNCTLEIRGEYLPVVVDGKCEGHKYSSSFIFPNHPFTDLVLYSLCAWSLHPDYTAIRSCPVIVPGTKHSTEVGTSFSLDYSNNTYLEDVYCNYNSDM